VNILEKFLAHVIENILFAGFRRATAFDDE